MKRRLRVPLAARICASILSVIVLGIFSASSFAVESGDAGSVHEASPTSTTTPAALKPIVLITGGTVPSICRRERVRAFLSSAEIYDPALHRFLPIAAMNERRDQFSAAAIAMDKVLIVGGIKHAAGPAEPVPRAGDAVDTAFRRDFRFGHRQIHGRTEHEILSRRADSHGVAKRQSIDCRRRLAGR